MDFESYKGVYIEKYTHSQITYIQNIHTISLTHKHTHTQTFAVFVLYKSKCLYCTRHMAFKCSFKAGNKKKVKTEDRHHHHHHQSTIKQVLQYVHGSVTSHPSRQAYQLTDRRIDRVIGKLHLQKHFQDLYFDKDISFMSFYFFINCLFLTLHRQSI